MAQASAPLLPSVIENRFVNSLFNEEDSKAKMIQLEEEKLAREFKNMLIQHEEEAYFALREEMMGKSIDNTWRAYSLKFLKKFLDKKAIEDHKSRVLIIEGCIRQFSQHLKTDLNLSDDEIDDKVVWWNPYTWQRSGLVVEDILYEHKETSNNERPNENNITRTQVLTEACIVLGFIYCGYKLCKYIFSSSSTPISPPYGPPAAQPNSSAPYKFKIL